MQASVLKYYVLLEIKWLGLSQYWSVSLLTRVTWMQHTNSDSFEEADSE